MNRQETIDRFIDWYAETSTGREHLTKDIGEIFDYIDKLKIKADKYDGIPYEIRDEFEYFWDNIEQYKDTK